MSQILGQTATTVDSDAAYDASGTWDTAPPFNIQISCLGLNRSGNNSGTVGMIFELSIPDGYTLDVGHSGSLPDLNDRSIYNRMSFPLQRSGGAGASTHRWEIWFRDTDVNDDGWGVPMLVTDSGSGSTYTYTFKKGGSGGGRRR